MTLDEALDTENPSAITRQEAISEYVKHGLSDLDFMDDFGNGETFSSFEILWMLVY